MEPGDIVEVRAITNGGRVRKFWQAAKVLSISERTLWGLTKAGDIPAVRFGGRNVRYSPDDLRAWIQKRSEKKCESGHNT